MNDPEFSSNPYQAPQSEPEFLEPEFPGGHPLLTIWTRPRATLRHILNTDPTRGVLPLAMLQGVSQALAQAVLKNMGDHFSSGQILAVCLIVGPFGGIISLYLSAAVVCWTGSWIGGRGTREGLRAALAWSYVPSIGSLLLLVPEYVLLGQQLFTSATPKLDDNPGLALLVLVLGLVEIVLGLWSAVLMFKCIGEAHQFSAWKALGVVALGVLVMIAIFLPVILVTVLLVVTSGVRA